jgi:hypothetical protein
MRETLRVDAMQDDKFKLTPEQETWVADLQEKLDTSTHFPGVTKAELGRWPSGAAVIISGDFADLMASWSSIANDQILADGLRSWNPDWGYLLVYLNPSQGDARLIATQIDNHTFTKYPAILRPS